MLSNIKPVPSGNGLTATYENEEHLIYFSILLTEGLDDRGCAEAIASARNQLLEVSPNISTTQRYASISGEFSRRNFDLIKNIDLYNSKNIKNTVREALNGKKDAIFMCPDKETYIQGCQALGLNKADHLACAEMHALFQAKVSNKQYIAGYAHKVKDQIDQVLSGKFKQGIIIKSPHLEFVFKYFSDSIPQAVKFNLGKSEYFKNIQQSVDTYIHDIPSLYRPPSKLCLVITDTPYETNEELNFLQVEKTYHLIREEGKDLFAAYVLHIGKNGDIFAPPFFCVWDISGGQLWREVRSLNPNLNINDLSEEEINEIKDMPFQIMPEIAKINSFKTEITIIDAPFKLNKKRQKENKSPYYSYHVLKPANSATVNSNNTGDDYIPRKLHYRRGHYRTYSHERYKNLAGHTIWVEEKFWGDPLQGVIGKEYDMS